MPETCLTERDLRNYALGACDAATSEEIERHLSRCPACEETLAGFDDTDDSLVRHLPLTPAVMPELVAATEGRPGWLERLREAPTPGPAEIPAPVEHKPDPRLADESSAYELLGILGQGGMGIVYRARHRQLDRVVALKVLHPRLTAAIEARQRFEREIRILGSLRHPGVVMATDAGRLGSAAYLVMEFIDGIDLARLVRRTGPLSVAEACFVGRDMAEAIAAAHRAGVVHRDVKPSNVMIDRAGHVKLLDFGLAHLATLTADDPETSLGRLLGTLEYMAPEQAGPERLIGEKVDLYGLGATLFFLLTGRSPRGTGVQRSLLEQLRSVSEEQPCDVRSLRADVPAALSEWIAALLSRDPAARPNSAALVAKTLSEWSGGHLEERVAATMATLEDAPRPDERDEAERSLSRMLGIARDELPVATNAASAVQPSSAGTAGARTGRRVACLFALAAAAFAIYFGITIILETPDGTLRIESEVTDVRVEVVDDKDQPRAMKIDRKENETVLRAGTYRVRFAGAHDGLSISPDVVTLHQGKTEVARITRILRTNASTGAAPAADSTQAVTVSPSKPTTETFSGGAPQPILVRTAKVETRDVDLHMNFRGNIAAYRTVTVGSRVDGKIVKIAFEDGQTVKEGDLLAEIESRTYELQLEQATGQLNLHKAALDVAKVNLSRVEALFMTARTDRAAVDEKASQVQQLEGTIRSDEAHIEAARFQVASCRIVAPISGKIGFRRVDQGAVLRANDRNGLADILQIQPVTVVFSFPQNDLIRIQKRRDSGVPIAVEVSGIGNSLTKSVTGKLAAIDNQVNPVNGTLMVKAVIDNDDHALLPNQSVNVRMPIETIRNAIVIPSSAVLQNNDEAYVYLVQSDDTVKRQPIIVRSSEKDEAVIASGLKSAEVVVTAGYDKLADGSSVTTQEKQTAPAGARADVRLYQGQPESVWQRGFDVERDPVAKVTDARALISFATDLPAEKQVDRIVEIGGGLIESAWGDEAVLFPLGWLDGAPRQQLPPVLGTSQFNPGSPQLRPFIQTSPSESQEPIAPFVPRPAASTGVHDMAIWPDVPRWQVSKELQESFENLLDLVQLHLTRLPAPVVADRLSHAIVAGKPPEAAVAAALLTFHGTRRHVETDPKGVESILGRLREPVRGLDQTAIAVLVRACYQYWAKAVDAAEKERTSAGMNQLGRRIIEAPPGSIRGPMINAWIMFARTGNVAVDSKVAAEVVHQYALAWPKSTMHFVFGPREMAHTERMVKFRRSQIAFLIDSWIEVANRHLREREATDDSTRAILDSLDVVLCLRLPSDEWDVVTTAESLTGRLRRWYSADALAEPAGGATSDSPAALLTNIARIRGAIPEFAKAAPPSAVEGLEQLKQQALLMARDRQGASSFNGWQAALRGLADRVSPLRAIAPYATMQTALSDSLLLSQMRAQPQGRGGGPGGSTRSVSLDPLLLLAVISDLSGADDAQDEKIAAYLADGDWNLGSSRRSASAGRNLPNPDGTRSARAPTGRRGAGANLGGPPVVFTRLLESPTALRPIAHDLLRNIRQRTQNAALREVVNSIDPE